ncbi:MAG: hypothetical protein ACI9NT_000143 [Bacteroidia bacterium]|jgi:hypothetical protein
MPPKQERDVKRYSRKTRSRRIYYSIHVTQRVGFTDQTMLVALLCKLGALLELQYHFTPVHDSISSRHSGISADLDWEGKNTGQYSGIFDYVGFDNFFAQRSKTASVEAMSCVDIVFARNTVGKQQFTNSQDMISAVKALIVGALPNGDAPLHVRFEIARQGDVVKWLHELPNDLLDFNYTDIYWKFRAQHCVSEVFDSKAPKLLMHIRQGDTAVIETPWKSYVQIWGKGKDPYCERERVNDIQDNVVITVADFEIFYTELKSQLTVSSLSTLVHSDGFSRAFFKLNKRLDRLDLNAEKIELLQQSREGYNDRAFKVFEKHTEAKLFVGEDLDLLYELIHAFYTCDILIVGTQQRMLAKQYAFSFLEEHEGHASPLLVTLYKREAPDYAIYGNPHMQDRCLNVDLTNYDIVDVAAQVTAFLASRY